MKYSIILPSKLQLNFTGLKTNASHIPHIACDFTGIKTDVICVTVKKDYKQITVQYYHGFIAINNTSHISSIE